MPRTPTTRPACPIGAICGWGNFVSGATVFRHRGHSGDKLVTAARKHGADGAVSTDVCCPLVDPSAAIPPLVAEKRAAD